MRRDINSFSSLFLAATFDYYLMIFGILNSKAQKVRSLCRLTALVLHS